VNSAPEPQILATPLIPPTAPVGGPLIVQSDRTVLLEVAHPAAEDARHDLAVFAELERAPEHIHTYRITRLGLWNARAAGHTAENMLATLERYRRALPWTSPRRWAATDAS
jgi:DNA excision repair protein ERCC-3